MNVYGYIFLGIIALFALGLIVAFFEKAMESPFKKREAGCQIMLLAGILLLIFCFIGDPGGACRIRETAPPSGPITAPPAPQPPLR